MGVNKGSVIGIDPGLSGAVALFTPEGHQLQVWRDFKCLKDISEAVMCAFLAGKAAPYPGELKAVIEFVHAFPHQGVTSMFNFGKSTGVAMGSVFSHPLPLTEIAPQRWQLWAKKTIVLDSRFANSVRPTKVASSFDSRKYACTVFPTCTGLFQRVMDHGTADAALIALWGHAHPVSNDVNLTS